MASANHVTEKSIAHQNQQLLKCPRCDSSNTKFCYYNNYNLSQPRHFCKACKRYWTKGGTLRNVPVGGGCRKNKRIKRTFTTTANHGANTSITSGHNSNPNVEHYTPSNTNLNPFYGLLQQNPKFPRFDTRVSDIGDNDVHRYDLLHPQMGSLGLGFSSSDPGDTVVNHAHNSFSLVPSYSSMFRGGSNASGTSNPMMASIFTSSHQHEPRFMGFTTYGDGGGSLVNDVQMEGTKSSIDWKNRFNGQNDNDQIKSAEASDPASFLWTTTVGDGEEWLDPTSSIRSWVP